MYVALHRTIITYSPCLLSPVSLYALDVRISLLESEHSLTIHIAVSHTAKNVRLYIVLGLLLVKLLFRSECYQCHMQ